MHTYKNVTCGGEKESEIEKYRNSTLHYTDFLLENTKKERTRNKKNCENREHIYMNSHRLACK